MTTPAEAELVGASRQTPSKRRPETSDPDVSSPAKRLQILDTPPPPPTAKRLLFDEAAAPAHPAIKELHDDNSEVLVDALCWCPCMYTHHFLVLRYSLCS